jgi:hypothetical protein
MATFDEKAEAWVKSRYPGANLIPGSVVFEIDASYWGEMDVDLDVNWAEEQPHGWTPKAHSRTLTSEAHR